MGSMSYYGLGFKTLGVEGGLSGSRVKALATLALGFKKKTVQRLYVALHRFSGTLSNTASGCQASGS